MQSDDSNASHALLSAALGGLLCVAACSSPKSSVGQDSGNDAAASGDAPAEAASGPYECDGGVVDDAGITSSQVLSMTLEDFTAQCNAKNGVVEIEPHCGGSNNCRGMSYDTTTQVLTEHGCRGLNTCAGYSCIICD